MADRAELTTLKNLLSQADHILETTPPLQRTAQAQPANCWLPRSL